MARLAGFKGEYLWELDIPEAHLIALAEAIPAERYDWRPGQDVRSVSEVLVHIAAGNFVLLDLTGVRPPLDYYPVLEEQGTERFFALVARNLALEKTVTTRPAVLKMLKDSIAAVRDGFTRSTVEELDRRGTFFGELTTVRRVYLRVLAHMHEHMGQLVAYARVMGVKAPWPDPADFVKAHFENR